MKQKLAGLLIRIGVSLGSLAAILYLMRHKLGEALWILKTEVSWTFFALAMGLYLIVLGFLSLRMQIIFRVQEILLTFRDSLYLNFVGLFFNLFLPSAVGGDVAKAYYAYKHSGKKIAATTSVLLDRLLGFVTIILMALAAVVFYHREIGNPRLFHFLYVFMGLMVFSFVFFASRRVARSFKFATVFLPEKFRATLSEIYHAIHGYKHYRSVLLLTLAISLMAQTLVIVTYFLLTRSLGIKMPLGLFFILVPVLTIVSMAPSLGGLGVREAGSIYLFSRFMPPERALALSLLLDMVIYAYCFVGGIAYALCGGMKPQSMEEMEV